MKGELRIMNYELRIMNYKIKNNLDTDLKHNYIPYAIKSFCKFNFLAHGKHGKYGNNKTSSLGVLVAK